MKDLESSKDDNNSGVFNMDPMCPHTDVPWLLMDIKHLNSSVIKSSILLNTSLGHGLSYLAFASSHPTYLLELSRLWTSCLPCLRSLIIWVKKQLVHHKEVSTNNLKSFTTGPSLVPTTTAPTSLGDGTNPWSETRRQNTKE